MPTLINTRPIISGDELEQIFQSSEIQILRIPVFETVDLPPRNNLEQILKRGDYGLFSSPRAVQWFEGHGIKTGLPLICFGLKTQEAMHRAGFEPVAVGSGASVLHFISENFHQKNIIHFCSAQTRLDAAALKECDIEMRNVPVYTPEMLKYPESQINGFKEQIARAQGFLFFSGSAVRYFSKMFRGQADLFTEKLCLASGDSALKALQALGVQKIRQAEGPEVEKMVLLIRQCYE